MTAPAHATLAAAFKGARPGRRSVRHSGMRHRAGRARQASGHRCRVPAPIGRGRSTAARFAMHTLSMDAALQEPRREVLRAYAARRYPPQHGCDHRPRAGGLAPGHGAVPPRGRSPVGHRWTGTCHAGWASPDTMLGCGWTRCSACRFVPGIPDESTCFCGLAGALAARCMLAGEHDGRRLAPPPSPAPRAR